MTRKLTTSAVVRRDIRLIRGLLDEAIENEIESLYTVLAEGRPEHGEWVGDDVDRLNMLMVMLCAAAAAVERARNTVDRRIKELEAQ